jgi:hypothetical protein
MGEDNTRGLSIEEDFDGRGQFVEALLGGRSFVVGVGGGDCAEAEEMRVRN